MSDTNGAGAPQPGAPAGGAAGGAGANAAGGAQPVVPKMQILGQFIRDMSFENVAAQKAMAGNAQPEITVQVALDARKRAADNQYDVIVKLIVNAKTKDAGEPIFVLELEYAGIFLIENVPNEQMHPFLLIECPRQLFPFLRRIVSDVTHDGGFPPLNLETIDFLSLYRQQLSQMQANQAAGAGSGTTPSGG
ncbi:MAG: protein-export chaperone SecB [Rhodobacteraceae bacterium]|nr:protein-export chaperone SecB [Paracoccaceae bacterium]